MSGAQRETKASAKRKPGKRARRDQAQRIYDVLARQRPDPRTELHYRDAYTLLVAVALSAQATDVGVNKATNKLFTLADTPRKMLELGEDRIRETIRTLGLFRNKAKNLVAMAEMLVRDHGGQVPKDRDALERLPGVGRKTANVVLNEAFGEPTIAVDTHVFRVGNRTGMAPGRTPLEVEKALLEVTADHYRRGAHHWLILHGRYVCRARKPLCGACSIRTHCRFEQKTLDGDQSVNGDITR
ncbi:MAG: endonuclease III [Geminicoccaceae bacterium]